MVMEALPRVRKSCSVKVRWREAIVLKTKGERQQRAADKATNNGASI